MEVSVQNRITTAYIRLRALVAGWDVPAVYLMVTGKSIAADPSGRPV